VYNVSLVVPLTTYSASNNGVTLKCGLAVVRSLKMALFDRSKKCVVFELKRDIGVKRHFSYPFSLICTIT